MNRLARAISRGLAAPFARWFRPAEEPPPQQIIQKKSLSPEKQKELEELCRQLLKRRELITSGKLQFIGLSKIKKRMGRGWAGLSKIVYDTAEAAIHKYIGKGDLFIRYQDDCYLLIFATASLEEGKQKAALIAEEIRRQLFELNENDLRDIEIREAVREMKTANFLSLSFPDFLENFSDDVSWQMDDELLGMEEEAPPAIDAVDVGTGYARPPAASALQDGIEAAVSVPFSIVYHPLWDVQRKALTTYLCLPAGAADDGMMLDGYDRLFDGRPAAAKLVLDLRILEHVAAELARMAQDGRRLFIACPVHYETLYGYESYESFKAHCLKMPLEQRQYLILLVMEPMEGTPMKKAYWFLPPLRNLVRHTFLMAPLKPDVQFQAFRGTGIQAVGTRTHARQMGEQASIGLLRNFALKAKSFAIPKTFVLDVATLSMTTSSVCAGFDYLGGTGIHEGVAAPSTVHQFRYEDLVSELIVQ